MESIELFGDRFEATRDNPSTVNIEVPPYMDDLAIPVSHCCPLQLIARTINLIPMIREAAIIFAIATAEHLGTQRLGDQYGTLMAGAWSLCHQCAPTLEEAREWLKCNPLSAQAESSEVADEKSCLQTILEHQIRVDVDGGAKNRTVLALLKIVCNSTVVGEEGIDDVKASRALGRIGLVVKDGRLAVSNTSKGLRRLLRDTPWESCWPTILGRMDGATKPGAVWFPEIGTSRATSLPMPELGSAVWYQVNTRNA
jgi:putative DNA primase/helicase